MTEFAFNECVSICASGQNPSGLKWIMPGSCTNNDFCVDNEYCDIGDVYVGNGRYESMGWGACELCDPTQCREYDIPSFAWEKCEAICEDES